MSSTVGVRYYPEEQEEVKVTTYEAIKRIESTNYNATLLHKSYQTACKSNRVGTYKDECKAETFDYTTTLGPDIFERQTSSWRNQQTRQSRTLYSKAADSETYKLRQNERNQYAHPCNPNSFTSQAEVDETINDFGFTYRSRRTDTTTFLSNETFEIAGFHTHSVLIYSGTFASQTFDTVTVPGWNESLGRSTTAIRKINYGTQPAGYGGLDNPPKCVYNVLTYEVGKRKVMATSMSPDFTFEDAANYGKPSYVRVLTQVSEVSTMGYHGTERTTARATSYYIDGNLFKTRSIETTKPIKAFIRTNTTVSTSFTMKAYGVNDEPFGRYVANMGYYLCSPRNSYYDEDGRYRMFAGEYIYKRAEEEEFSTPLITATKTFKSHLQENGTDARTQVISEIYSESTKQRDNHTTTRINTGMHRSLFVRETTSATTVLNGILKTTEIFYTQSKLKEIQSRIKTTVKTKSDMGGVYHIDSYEFLTYGKPTRLVEFNDIQITVNNTIKYQDVKKYIGFNKPTIKNESGTTLYRFNTARELFGVDTKRLEGKTRDQTLHYISSQNAYNVSYADMFTNTEKRLIQEEFNDRRHVLYATASYDVRKKILPVYKHAIKAKKAGFESAISIAKLDQKSINASIVGSNVHGDMYVSINRNKIAGFYDHGDTTDKTIHQFVKKQVATIFTTTELWAEKVVIRTKSMSRNNDGVFGANFGAFGDKILGATALTAQAINSVDNTRVQDVLSRARFKLDKKHISQRSSFVTTIHNGNTKNNANVIIASVMETFYEYKEAKEHSTSIINWTKDEAEADSVFANQYPFAASKGRNGEKFTIIGYNNFDAKTANALFYPAKYQAKYQTAHLQLDGRPEKQLEGKYLYLYYIEPAWADMENEQFTFKHNENATIFREKPIRNSYTSKFETIDEFTTVLGNQAPVVSKFDTGITLH